MQSDLTPFKEWCEKNGIGLTTGYKLLKEKKINAVKLGKLTMVTRAESERFVNSLQPYKPEHARV